MTLVAVVAIVDIVLIVFAFLIALASRTSQRREVIRQRSVAREARLQGLLPLSPLSAVISGSRSSEPPGQ